MTAHVIPRGGSFLLSWGSYTMNGALGSVTSGIKRILAEQIGKRRLLSACTSVPLAEKESFSFSQVREGVWRLWFPDHLAKLPTHSDRS